MVQNGNALYGEWCRMVQNGNALYGEWCRMVQNGAEWALLFALFPTIYKRQITNREGGRYLYLG